MTIEITEADLKNHKSISAIIKDKYGKVLVQDHAKYGFVSVPMGKVEEGISVEGTLDDELFCECNIHPIKYKLIDNRNIYHTVKGIDLVADHYMFEIAEYNGNIFNKEPTKHINQYFISIEELSKKNHISHVVRVFLELNGIKRDLKI